MEPYLNERIEAAKTKAKQIIDGQVENEEDLRLIFQFALCQKYNIPVFDSYFEDRTLDEIMFEVYLHKESARRNDPEIQKEEAAQAIRSEGIKEEYWEDLEEFDMQTDEEFLEQAKKDFGLQKENSSDDEST